LLFRFTTNMYHRADKLEIFRGDVIEWKLLRIRAKGAAELHVEELFGEIDQLFFAEGKCCFASLGHVIVH